MSDAILSAVGFIVILALLVIIYRKGFKVYEEFPYNWCPLDCWPPSWQKEPCKDCPLKKISRPEYLGEEDA